MWRCSALVNNERGEQLPNPEDDPQLKDRVQRLMKFLRELVKARTKPVRNLRQHDNIIWLSGNFLSMSIEHSASGGEVLLRARRISLDDAPAVPVGLRGWVLGNIADSASMPTLSEESSGVDVTFERWLAEWRMWAKLDQERRPFWLLYQDLQKVLQELTSRPESVELVLASGLLELSANAAGEDIRTHIISQSATVERDESSGDLLVRLSPDSAPRLEDTQLLTGLHIFDGTGSRSLQESLIDYTSPVADNIVVFLKEWAARALTTTVEVGDTASASRTGRALTPAPALVLRKRGAFALVEYYEAMIAEAEHDGTAIPLGLAQLVTPIEPEDRIAWLERTGSAATVAYAEDPLFPLPANREQGDIIERLIGDSGVVVEGPPGTGKTHTIANLVSALLAKGQRVLVTSEKSQALRVLRDKLPDEMKELCVSITDIGRGGSTELNKSVAEIATRKASFNHRASAEVVDGLNDKRNQALSRKAVITEEIRALRERETFKHPFVAQGYLGTAAEIVRDVVACGQRYEWLPAPLQSAAPSLDLPQFRQLLALASQSNPVRAQRAHQMFPVIEGRLPQWPDLQRACEAAATIPAPLNPAAAELLQVLDGASPATLAEIGDRCKRLQFAVAAVRELDPAYQGVADGILSGSAAHLWSKTAKIPELLHVAAQADQHVGVRVVETEVDGRRAAVVFNELAVAMENGQEWRGRFRKSDQQKAVEELGPVPTVDGQPATSTENVRYVAEHLRALDCVRSAAAILADLGVSVTTKGSRALQVNNLHRTVSEVQTVNACVAEVRTLVERLVAVGQGAPPIRGLAQAQAVAAAAGAVADTDRAEQAQTYMRQLSVDIAGAFAGAVSPESQALIEAIDAADIDGISHALTGLEIARRERDEEIQLNTLSAQLESEAPNLAQLIRGTSDDSSWNVRLDELDDAWAWRRAQVWVQKQHEPGRDKELEHVLDVTEADISQLTAKLAAERAWIGCLERMTAEQVGALQSYRDHVANIGKGTGKYAETFRVAARDAMQKAQGAVPAWVMPLQQVLASIPPEPNSFDVVIVDEASQADLSSLFLLWLAPRVIVVGDDKQCAPSEVASGALDDVFGRLETYLPDMPVYLRSSLTPRSSMFSMLRTRFGQVVRLREHFRCMPEIINWSSNQFYRDAPLIPVRQYGADRLPPLRTTYVPGGAVTGKNAALVNRTEALAIADAIEACLSDTAYAGKTFGVVVLQGQRQVDLIQNELLKRLDVDQWEDRRLRIGTPPDFQGDERHVILLSMVIGPEKRVMAMTKNEYQRRYNVAASRAQDQLWLFHSVTSDNLQSTDLRHSLMTYMQSTSSAPADPMPEHVTRDSKHSEFDSLFEQRIFLDIVARGYHVNCQVEVNGRRIDLVVTGSAGRLAVECDGDHWHSTPDQVRSDMERERELKRCGWEFWRIRESEYYMDPVASLSGLWAELDRRGISPGSVSSLPLAKAATAVWFPPEMPNDESLAEDVAEAELANVIPADVPVPAVAAPVAVTVVDIPDVSGAIADDVVDTLPFVEPVVEALPVVEPVVVVEEIPQEETHLADPSSSQASKLEVSTAWEVMPDSAIPRPDDYLFDRILAIVESEPVSSRGLAASWNLNHPQVWSALRKLTHDGRLIRSGTRPNLTYELAARSGGSDPVDDSAKESVVEYISIAPRLMQTLIVSELKSGPIDLSTLASRLRADPDAISEALEILVSMGLVEFVNDRYALPGESESAETALPPADRNSAKAVLTAAAWMGPITIPRGRRITRLPADQLTAILAELVSEGLLRKQSSSDGDEWARP